MTTDELTRLKGLRDGNKALQLPWFEGMRVQGDDAVYAVALVNADPLAEIERLIRQRTEALALLQEVTMSHRDINSDEYEDVLCEFCVAVQELEAKP